jgi:hypothetical protein
VTPTYEVRIISNGCANFSGLGYNQITVTDDQRSLNCIIYAVTRLVTS